ncbi:MAG: HPr kinase/phosphorylase [Betaproteobacteria bacterium]|uniref:HPr(Ser) kinase/phosphatase n=1 Tax=Thiomonas sp. FB-6 TaxID=1158291 RepID=UPI0003818F91|nr:HPr(Ser) kinase/phosphatase [Thiomonas sp. FB-6]MBU6440039.1 HPr kinase/phosphorylase [Betaproteobacteria bacterium]MBU6512440.1 HPr kinase/phosphorylase [Betaproteobacteria bacterium]MDE1956075.1 HPr kinase/phosphorylase [Betaproteobacteria bacterium]MDE2152654.1 HPr kinase/phosphorylase [Betaproteobacteria bacterium]MDE2478302.1 HPr kinase/phosphorylase [Betaproteobacteria bacterium]
MKAATLSADRLFEANTSLLKWRWVAGQRNPERRFDDAAVQGATSGADLVGYLNYIHPYRVQILGWREVHYLMHADEADSGRRVRRVVGLGPPALVIADGQEAPPALLKTCDDSGIPVFVTDEPAAFVIDVLRAYLSKLFANRTTLHGVFMDILGLGVLITGESGLGKSELGLELISRGHGLVADDCVELSRVTQSTVEGHCPPLLQNLLEVRGIGILDIRTIFGETAVRRKMRLRLIVHLVRRDTQDRDFERLPTGNVRQDVLGVAIRKVLIPVEAGRNLAVLVEAAVRNTILQLRGIDTFKEFQDRQRLAMLEGGDD